MIFYYTCYEDSQKNLFQTQEDNLYFYRTRAGSKIDFVRENKSFNLIELKYRNKVPNTNLAFDNFSKANPKLAVSKKIIVTKDKFAYWNEIYFIPAFLVPFVKI